MLVKIKTGLTVVLAIVAVIIGVSISHAGGLGSNYVGDGNVYVTITKNPHNTSYPWGVVNPHTGEDSEVGQRRFVGYYEDQILQFWADGKNKRFETGHGKNVNESNKFVINGVKFIIDSEIPTISTFVEEDVCLEPDIDYIPVEVDRLQYIYSTVSELWTMRIITSGSGIDWTLFNDGEITVEVIFNDSFNDICDAPYTYSLVDTVEYFNCFGESTCSSSGITGQKEGYRSTNTDKEGLIDTAELNSMLQLPYTVKTRVTTEKGGIDKNYVYIRNIDDHSDLVDSIVNVKIRLYQNGELIQAYEGDKIMTSNVQ